MTDDLKAAIKRVNMVCSEQWGGPIAANSAPGEFIADLRMIIAAAEGSETRDDAMVTFGERSGLLRAAMICGSLAETTYDDSDGFAAATGCEAAIRAHLTATYDAAEGEKDRG